MAALQILTLSILVRIQVGDQIHVPLKILDLNKYFYYTKNMNKKINKDSCCNKVENFNIKDKCQKHQNCNSGCSGIYFLGLIGAAIYFIQQATSFWLGVIGLLKAFVWPAFLIYGLLDFLKI